MTINVTFDTNRGPIHLRLHEDRAPITVANFVNLAKRGYYDGLSFHRVIADFMIQGGDPYSKDPNDRRVGSGGPGYKIKCETAGNPLKHAVGALSMAHAGKDTGGSPFFICHSPQAHLDRKHTVFGQVISGAEIIDKIQAGDKMSKVWIE